MNWKTKARIQNAFARLPKSIAYPSYRWVVRNLGRLRSFDPTSRFIAGVRIADFVRESGESLQDKRLLEVGTGYRLNLPIALWLCGAASITTCDLNPYLQARYVKQDLAWVRANQQKVIDMFSAHAQPEIFKERLAHLKEFNGSLGDLCALCNIRYLAPADASDLPLEDGSIDLHFSYVVMEHIPPPVLQAILAEGQRVLSTNGLLIHRVDMSDHFSHSDRSITKINFLQFNEEEWDRLAGNLFMYQNRLRVDDVVGIFQSAGLDVLKTETNLDERSLKAIEAGFPLDKRFAPKPNEINATTGVWLVSRKTAEHRQVAV